MDIESAIDKVLPVRGNNCPVATLLESLDEKNRLALNDAITKGVPVHIITKALRSEGLRMAEETLRIHKLGACKCATK
jgi:hypothetical protein